MTQVFRGFARGRYIFTGGMDQFEAFLNDPTSAAALSAFTLYLQRVPLGGRSIDDSGRQDIPVWEPAFFFQDKWSIRPNLTLNLGLRWEGYNSPGMLTPPGETPYARYFSDPNFPTDTGEIPDDWSGWQPRVGITWDPTSDGRTVVRANFGLFKARTPSLIWANPRTANGVIFETYNAVIVPGANFGVPTYPESRQHRRVREPDTGIAVVDKDFKNPESRQIGFSVEREVVPNLAVGAAYNYARTRHLTRFTDPNVDPGRLRAGRGRPSDLCRRQHVTRPAVPHPGPGAHDREHGEEPVQRLHPDREQAVQRSLAAAGQLDDLRRQVGRRQRARSVHGPLRRPVSTSTSEYSHSDRHSRNRINIFGLFDLPADFQFTTLVQYRSPQPTTGTDLIGQDLNLDGYANDRRFVNGQDVGRNQQEKDNEFFTIDLRVSKAFRLRENRSLEAIFEVFNLTNSDNNIVSQISGGLLFDFNGTLRSGVGDPRQAQIGLRFRF